MKRVYKRGILFIIIILMVAIFKIPTVFAAGVKPLVIDIDAKPGDVKEFKLHLIPGRQEEQVKLSLYQPVQLTSGSLTYQKCDEERFPAAKWVNLDQDEVMVYPGENSTVSGTVKIPFDAGGSNTVVIMVEPQTTSQQKGGVRFMVRYAVRINIRVKRPGLRTEAELLDFTLKEGKEKEPIVRAKIYNPSFWDYLVAGEVMVRDEDRRLVERLTLRTISGRKNDKDKTRIYPGSEVDYLAEVTKRLTPGEYNLRLFMRYGEHGQIIKSKKIKIEKGDFNFPTADEIGAFSLEPKEIDLELKAGQRKSTVLRLNSELGEPSYIRVSGKEIKKDYSHSLLEWIKLRGKSEFELKGRRRGNVILTVGVPRDIKAGSYHGNLVLDAFNLENGKLITKKEVPVSVLVGEEREYDINIRSLYAARVEAETIISLDIFNSGEVFIKPEAKLIIKDKDGNFIERVQLNLSKGVNRVLPLKSQQLKGVAKEISTGNYIAEITLYHGNKELKLIREEFKVE